MDIFNIYIFYFETKNIWRVLIIKDLLINDQINFPEVRLVGNQAEQLGIVSSAEANRTADEQNLDLVLISPNAKPPVCKLMDYGKYKFELQKKQREAKKKQKEKMVELKGMRLGLNIGEHDMQFKAKTVIKFLQAGDKVKVSLRLRGRERAYSAKAIETMNKFAELLSEHSVVEKKPKLNGFIVLMFLAPKK